MSHTKLPWTVKKGHKNCDCPGQFGTVEDSDGFRIVTVWSDVSRLQRSAKANARLIAAAPDLFVALAMLLADIEDYQRINLLGGENNHAQVRARAALAKAEGK